MPIPNGPSIDEKKLLKRVRAIEGRQSRKTSQLNPFPNRIDGNSVVAELLAHNLGNARQQCLLTAGSTIIQNGSVRSGQGKPDFGMRQSEAFHNISYGCRFSPIGLEEFQACRCGEKQVPYFNLCTGIQGGGDDRGFVSAVNRDFPACI